MLLIILALVWIALLAPMVVKRIRENSSDRSIQSFHTEHQVLSRQEYTVPPAHRLDQTDQFESRSSGSGHRPRLTVVHDDDTYRSLESRGTWDEWSRDYDYDHDDNVVSRREAFARNDASMNRYAAAYSSVQRDPVVHVDYQGPLRRRSMRNRRRVVLTRLVLSAVVLSVAAFVTGYSVITDLAIVAWVGVVGFIGAAIFAVSQGMLPTSSLPLRVPQRRELTTIQPLYEEPAYQYDEFASEFYEPDSDVRWRRESQSRRALG